MSADIQDISKTEMSECLVFLIRHNPELFYDVNLWDFFCLWNDIDVSYSEIYQELERVAKQMQSYAPMPLYLDDVPYVDKTFIISEQRDQSDSQFQSSLMCQFSRNIRASQDY